MSGPEVVSYLYEVMRRNNRAFTFAELERQAGIAPQRISQWNRTTQPSYNDVQKLGRALAQHYPELGVGAYSLLKRAGFDPEPDPEAVAFESDVRTWDEITVKFHAASKWERYKIIRAVEKAFDERP